MSSYESEPGVDPVRITTFRRLRRRWKFGEAPAEEARVYDDLFVDTAGAPRR